MAIYLPDIRHTGETPLRQAQLILLRILRTIDGICSDNNLLYWMDGGTLLGAVRHKGFIPWDDDIDLVMPREDFDIFLAKVSASLPDDMELLTASSAPPLECYAVPCKVADKFSLVVERNLHRQYSHEQRLAVDIIPMDNYNTPGFQLTMQRFMKCLFRNLSKINDSRHKKTSRLHNLLSMGLDSFRPILSAEDPVRIFNRFLYRFVIPVNKSKKYSDFIGYGYDVHWTRIFRTKDVYPLQRIEFEGHSFPAPRNIDAVLRVFYQNYMVLPPPEHQNPTHYAELIIDTRNTAENRSRYG